MKSLEIFNIKIKKLLFMYIILMILPMFTFASTASFITQMEYASRLYDNPRGIGCQKCHGKNGEGKLIATYIHKGVKKSFAPPPINKLDFDVFFNKLNRNNKGMPRYYLTKKEIQALYFFLHMNEAKDEK